MARSSRIALSCAGAALVGAVLVIVAGVTGRSAAPTARREHRALRNTMTAEPATVGQSAPRVLGDRPSLESLPLAVANAEQELRRRLESAALKLDQGPALKNPEGPVHPEHAAFSQNNGRYVMEVLAPRVKECWGDVQGDGSILARHTFLIIDGRAVSSPVHPGDQDAITLEESDLSEDQDDVAVDCLRRAAEGTAFDYVPMEQGGDDSTYLAIYQRWPSPARIERERTSQLD